MSWDIVANWLKQKQTEKQAKYDAVVKKKYTSLTEAILNFARYFSCFNGNDEEIKKCCETGKFTLKFQRLSLKLTPDLMRNGIYHPEYFTDIAYLYGQRQETKNNNDDYFLFFLDTINLINKIYQLAAENFNKTPAFNIQPKIKQLAPLYKTIYNLASKPQISDEEKQQLEKIKKDVGCPNLTLDYWSTPSTTPPKKEEPVEQVKEVAKEVKEIVKEVKVIQKKVEKVKTQNKDLYKNIKKTTPIVSAFMLPAGNGEQKQVISGILLSQRLVVKPNKIHKKKKTTGLKAHRRHLLHNIRIKQIYQHKKRKYQDKEEIYVGFSNGGLIGQTLFKEYDEFKQLQKTFDAFFKQIFEENLQKKELHEQTLRQQKLLYHKKRISNRKQIKNKYKEWEQEFLQKEQDKFTKIQNDYKEQIENLQEQLRQEKEKLDKQNQQLENEEEKKYNDWANEYYIQHRQEIQKIKDDIDREQVDQLIFEESLEFSQKIKRDERQQYLDETLNKIRKGPEIDKKNLIKHIAGLINTFIVSYADLYWYGDIVGNKLDDLKNVCKSCVSMYTTPIKMASILTQYHKLQIARQVLGRDLYAQKNQWFMGSSRYSPQQNYQQWLKTMNFYNMSQAQRLYYAQKDDLIEQQYRTQDNNIGENIVGFVNNILVPVGGMAVIGYLLNRFVKWKKPIKTKAKPNKKQTPHKQSKQTIDNNISNKNGLNMEDLLLGSIIGSQINNKDSNKLDKYKNIRNHRYRVIITTNSNLLNSYRKEVIV